MSLDFILAAKMNFPMVIASANYLSGDSRPLLSFLAEHRGAVIEQLHQHGAVLFRGFSCQDEDYFSQAIEVCSLGKRCDTSDYDLPRTVLHNEVYTSSDLPGHVPLPLHHEKPRSKNPPHHIYFCCVIPAAKGGGTLFANAASIWQDMPKTIQSKILEHGVVYKQFFHGRTFKSRVLKKIWGDSGARCWAEYFGTDEKKQIEQKLAAAKIDWKWVNKGKDLLLLTYLPGILPHPMTQHINWFNSAAYLNYYTNLVYDDFKKLRAYKYLASQYMILKDIFPIICHYGNGQAFSAEEVAEINRISENHTRVLIWQPGDFMIVDNFTLMHGKQVHEGKRLLYSCMTERERCN